MLAKSFETCGLCKSLVWVCRLQIKAVWDWGLEVWWAPQVSYLTHSEAAFCKTHWCTVKGLGGQLPSKAAIVKITFIGMPGCRRLCVATWGAWLHCRNVMATCIWASYWVLHHKQLLFQTIHSAWLFKLVYI